MSSAAIDAVKGLGLVPAPPLKIDEARDAETLWRRRTDKIMVDLGLRPGKGAEPTVDCLIDAAVPFATLAENAIAKSIGEVRLAVTSHFRPPSSHIWHFRFPIR